MRETQLRPLSAHDQIEFLDWDAARVSVASKVTTMLAKFGALPEPEAAHLTVGQREAILLQLRQATFGDRMACVLQCPEPECSEKMDLDLMVRDLLMPQMDETSNVHEVTFDGYHVRFRLPEGADQEAVASLAQTDDTQAVFVLLKRCVLEVEHGSDRLTEIPNTIADRISDAMALLDPQAELILEPVCPACGNRFRTILDTATFFFSEIKARAHALLREVHVLASFYHWSEAEILSIPEPRRKFYLDLVEATQTRRGLA